MPAEIAAESRRKPVIAGDTAVEVAGRLVNQGHRKNAALKRAVSLYEECRRG